MLDALKKMFKVLDNASKRAETKCEQCGHINVGPHTECEKCNTPFFPSRE
jgi:uncharacterized OB-fold protein